MFSLKRLFGAVALACGVAFVSAGSASAAVVVPSSGQDYVFYWDSNSDPDPTNIANRIDDIRLEITDPPTNQFEWSINVAKDSILSFISVEDCCIAGDEFALYINNVLVAWDNVTPSVPDFFEADISNIFLSAGLTTFTLFVTQRPPNFDDGGAFIQFGATRAIPVPAALPLFLLGVAGLAFARGRKKRMARI